jgi:hypothetical protein
MPGADYFSRGAEATSVSSAGLPSAGYFWNHDGVTSAPTSEAVAAPPLSPVEPPSLVEPPAAASAHSDVATPAEEALPLGSEASTAVGGSPDTSLGSPLSLAVPGSNALAFDDTAEEQIEAETPAPKVAPTTAGTRNIGREGLEAIPRAAARHAERGLDQLLRTLSIGSLVCASALALSVASLLTVLGWKALAALRRTRSQHRGIRLGQEQDA